MTGPAQRSPRWSNPLGVVLRLLLVGGLLVPATLLFLHTWQSTDERRTTTSQERAGVEYVQTLQQLTVALTTAQSATVAGKSGASDDLNQAVEAVTSVDTRLGDELRTRERWTGIRAKIEALRDRQLTDPEQAYAAYSEITDLVLVLYGKIREVSGLIREPDPDAYYLQDAAVEELPEALVAAGRLADRAIIGASKKGSAERVRAGAELSLAQAALTSPVDDLVGDLQSASNDVEGAQFASDLLGQLDAYQRANETLVAAADTAANALLKGSAAPNVEPIGPALAAARTAGTQLSTVILSALAEHLKGHTDDDDGDQLYTGILFGLVVLFALGVGVLVMTTGRRSAARPADGQPQPGSTDDRSPAPDQSVTRHEAAAGRPGGPPLPDGMPEAGAELPRRGRSNAAR